MVDVWRGPNYTTDETKGLCKCKAVGSFPTSFDKDAQKVILSSDEKLFWLATKINFFFLLF